MPIYFLQAEDSGIKIGITNTIKAISERVAKLQEGSSLKFRLLGVIPGNRKEEQYLHRKFNHYKLRGEWFSMELKPRIESLISESLNNWRMQGKKGGERQCQTLNHH